MDVCFLNINWSFFRFDYLNKICGHRIMPVELGQKYTDDNWNQVLMPFYDYLKDYVFCESVIF